MNKKILEKTGELTTLIENSSTYQDYLKVKEKLEKNEKIMILIDNIKKLQKEIVQQQSHHIDTNSIEVRLKELETELLEIPLYSEFLNLQTELNQIFITIKEQVEHILDQNIL